ncbi:MAG: DUF4258 domain-containing protein [Patescibacteria group bacterium]|nr:DUF4258 domain-containing protein [Patescibacteria group bacterium]
MIIFTNHALLKLRQRGISKDVVRKTLKSPDYKISSYSGRIIAFKKFDKLTIFKSGIQKRRREYYYNYLTLGGKAKINQINLA